MKIMNFMHFTHTKKKRNANTPRLERLCCMPREHENRTIVVVVVVFVEKALKILNGKQFFFAMLR